MRKLSRRVCKVALFAILIFLSPAGSEARGQRKRQTESAFWLEPVPPSDNTTRARGRTEWAHLRDLVFKINWSPGEDSTGRGSHFKILEVPQPFLLASRIDLVPLLDSLTTNPSPDTGSVLSALAFMLLKHVDSPAATCLYLDWGTRRRHSLVWRTWPPPVPDDVMHPEAWVRNLGEPPVLDCIERNLEVWTRGWTRGYVLAYLATVDSPRALALLRSVFKSHPEHQADYVQSIVLGGLPVTTQAWRFLLEDVVPEGRARVQTGNRIDGSLMMWRMFAKEHPEKYVATFDPTQLTRLGEAFVQTTLADPAFPEIMVTTSEASRSSPPTNYDFAEAYHWGALSTFLDVCCVFGTRAQAGLLAARLDRMEGWLADSTVAWSWQTGTFNPATYPEVVADYKDARAKTLAAMPARQSRLGGAEH